MLLSNVKSVYPWRKYTFGILLLVTDKIALVNFSSATLIVSYVVVSYVTKSFDVSTFDFSPHSTIIPVLPLSIPYFCAKSGLLFISTASATIFSFAFLYCFARSRFVSSSVEPTKYLLTFLSMFFTFSLLSSVNVYSFYWLKSIGDSSSFCIP